MYNKHMTVNTSNRRDKVDTREPLKLLHIQKSHVRRQCRISIMPMEDRTATLEKGRKMKIKTMTSKIVMPLGLLKAFPRKIAYEASVENNSRN